MLTICRAFICLPCVSSSIPYICSPYVFDSQDAAAELNKVRMDAESALDEQKQGALTAAAAAQEEFDQSLARVGEEAQAREEALEKAHLKAMEKVQREHEKETKVLEKEHDKATKALEKEHAAECKRMQTEHAQEIRSLQEVSIPKP